MSTLYQVDEKRNQTTVWCDTPQEMVEIPLSTDEQNRKWKATVMANGTEWIGVTGGRSQLKKILEDEGWTEGVKKGEKTFDKLDPIKLPSLRRKRRHGPVGTNLDIHQVYAGRLEEAWTIMKREGHVTSNLRKTSVEIMVDIGANCDMSNEQMFWRGALASMLCDVLQRSGRSVRIIAYFCVSGFTTHDSKGSKKLTVACVAKDWMDPTELNNLFAITALSGFFRHHGFRAIIGYPYGPIASGLGRHVCLNEGDLDQYLGENESVRITIEEVWNEDSAKKKLEEFRNMMEANPTEEDISV